MSNNLRCEVMKCVHNMGQLCDAAKIEVANIDNSVSCKTYAEKGFTNMISEMGNMNVGGKLSDMFTSDEDMNPGVKCIVDKCVYNQNNQCGANNLKIAEMDSSATGKAECETFKTY